MSKFISIALIFILSASLLACATVRKFEDAKPSPFLNIPGVDRSSKLDNLPFQHSWVAPGVDRNNYSKIFLAPVTPSYVDLNDWERSRSSIITDKNVYRKEVIALSSYTTEKMREALNNKAENRYEVVRKAGPGTLVMEMALTEVIFGNPVASAGSLVAPIPGSTAMLAAVANPSVAYEVRLRDGVSGKVVATAADRATSATRPINLNRLTATSACHDIIEDSAKLLVAALNKDEGEEISKRRFKLALW